MYYLLVYLRRSCFLKDFIREIGLLVVWRHPDLPLQWFKKKINVEGLRACQSKTESSHARSGVSIPVTSYSIGLDNRPSKRA